MECTPKTYHPAAMEFISTEVERTKWEILWILDSIIRRLVHLPYISGFLFEFSGPAFVRSLLLLRRRSRRRIRVSFFIRIGPAFVGFLTRLCLSRNDKLHLSLCLNHFLWDCILIIFSIVYPIDFCYQGHLLIKFCNFLWFCMLACVFLWALVSYLNFPSDGIGLSLIRSLVSRYAPSVCFCTLSAASIWLLWYRCLVYLILRLFYP